ncbi:MAG: hypothetical protein Q7R93_02800 [bacterium]|nr:hypothetical protein [bacterium]
MCIGLNESVVVGKRSGTKPAPERQGRVGWMNNQLRIYYLGLGWITENELREFARKAWPRGSIFVSRTSYVPAPPIHGMQAWQWYGHGMRRFKVIYDSSVGWVCPKRFYGYEFPEWC